MLKDELIFEWNDLKTPENYAKHGVTFEEAQYAFLDINKILLRDEAHSFTEQRFYCLGLDRGKAGVLTVRFTYRKEKIRIFGAGYWRKEDDYMKTKIKYSEGPIDIADLKDLVRVPDFLPSPDEIARRMDKTKITITLSADSVEFFKKKAREHDLQYQLLIRHILDEYVAHQMQNEKENEKTKSGKAH